MSIYARFGSGNEDQIASNRGWGDVCRWVESLDHPPDQLQTLCNEGWAEPINELWTEIKHLLKQSPPKEKTVVSTLKGLGKLIASQEDQQDAIVITDGMSSDDD